jgi:hypothetical protein
VLGYYAYCVRQPCEASATGEGGGGPASYRITAACSQRLGEQRREADDRTRSASNPEQVRAAEARDSGLGSGADHAIPIEASPERKESRNRTAPSGGGHSSGGTKRNVTNVMWNGRNGIVCECMYR